MTRIDAIYQNGVFKPLGDISLPENQRVRLCIQSVDTADVRVWLARVQERQQRIIAERGYFPDSAADIAEDRRRFDKIARELGLTQPANGTATSVEEALEAAERIGYPVLVRPSYVLGGRAMQIVYDPASLQGYFATAARVSEERPVLIDRFLEDAFECDVDAISDGKRVVIGGIMQHIEEAGIHSGDSSCVLPAVDIPDFLLQRMREYTKTPQKALLLRLWRAAVPR